MRVSPIGFAYDTLEDVLEMATQSAEVSPTITRKVSRVRRLRLVRTVSQAITAFLESENYEDAISQGHLFRWKQ